MKNNIEFFIPMKKVPTVTHQQKKVHVVKNKPVFYETEELKEARSKFMSLLHPFAPEVPLDGPLRCITKWCFPDYKKKRKHGAWRETEPDTHNLNKLLYDVMEVLGFWVNDARVSSEINEKFWVRPDITPGGLYIAIWELE